MDPAAIKIMCLRQGDRPIEENVQDFIQVSHLKSISDLCLMIFFRGGLLESLYTEMQLHEPHWTLMHYIDLELSRRKRKPLNILFGRVGQLTVRPVGDGVCCSLH